jgi:hypothetical protein
MCVVLLRTTLVPAQKIIFTAAGGLPSRPNRQNPIPISQAIEYTVLIDGLTTVRIVSDQVGKRVGDCVVVEQGQFNNIRLAPESRCTPASAPTPPRPPSAEPASAAALEAANACDQAKVQVLQADTEEAFTLAERRMRLLCGE